MKKNKFIAICFTKKIIIHAINALLDHNLYKIKLRPSFQMQPISKICMVSFKISFKINFQTLNSSFYIFYYLTKLHLNYCYHFYFDSILVIAQSLLLVLANPRKLQWIFN